MLAADYVEGASTVFSCGNGSGADDDPSRASGYAEIRVVGTDGTRYAAPTLIHHYQPPQPFVDALMRAADLRLEIAWERDLLSCRAFAERRGGRA